MASYWNEQYPGYYYQWIAPLQTYGMKWMPLQDIYSPPCLDASMRWMHLAVPEGVNMIPLLGNSAMHMEKKAQECGASYLFYRSDLNKIEIWSTDLEGTMIKLNNYLKSLPIPKKSKKLVPPTTTTVA